MIAKRRSVLVRRDELEAYLGAASEAAYATSGTRPAFSIVT